MKIWKNDKFVDIFFNILLIVIAFICLYPIWYVLIASISEPSAVNSGQVILFPKNITFDGYKELLNYPQLLTGFRNSVLYLIGGSLLSLIVVLPTAYALSRPKLKGRKVLNFMFVISMYFSGGMIATYMLHSALGWVGTIWVVLIPPALSTYHMILARSSFESLPEALHESAQIDGASEFRFFIQFALPLCKATIAVIFLFSALEWWNQYMRFVIYMNDPNLQSVQVIVRQITNELESTLGTQMVGTTPEAIAEGRRLLDLLQYSIVVVVALPFILVYPFVQKYFNQGVMIGSVKE